MTDINTALSEISNLTITDEQVRAAVLPNRISDDDIPFALDAFKQFLAFKLIARPNEFHHVTHANRYADMLWRWFSSTDEYASFSQRVFGHAFKYDRRIGSVSQPRNYDHAFKLYRRSVGFNASSAAHFPDLLPEIGSLFADSAHSDRLAELV